MRKIVIALPKGKRLLPQSYEFFCAAGYTAKKLEQEIEKNDWKQLEFETDNGKAVFLLVRAADIPQYIDKSWADLGVSAFDCYREYELSNQFGGGSIRGDNFESAILPELGLCAKSRFCVAGLPAKKEYYERCKQSDERILSVATSNPMIAAKYMASQRIVADIITVGGSVELMPAHGGVDVIFDIVETGRALEENGLIIFEEAMPIQTKVLVSNAAMKYDENVMKMIDELKNAIK